MTKPIASALAIKPHLAVFDDLAAARLNALDLSTILVGMMSTIPSSVLPILAWQYHVEGNEGWNQATTDQRRREILRNAIELHRLKGTPWSVKEALRNIGINTVDFIEGGSKFLDGTWVLDGAWKIGIDNWASFQVNVYYIPTSGGIGSAETLPNGAPTDAVKAKIVEIINEYKPARCVLSAVNYVPLVYTITLTSDSTDIQCSPGTRTRIRWNISGDANVEWVIFTSIDGIDWKKGTMGSGAAPQTWSFEFEAPDATIETIMGRASVGAYANSVEIEMDLLLNGTGLNETFIRMVAYNASMELQSEHTILVTSETIDTNKITTDNNFITTDNQ